MVSGLSCSAIFGRRLHPALRSSSLQGPIRSMKILCVICAFVALICKPFRSQDLSSRPQFEVASVKPVPNDQIDDSAGATLLREIMRQDLRIGEIPMTAPDRVDLHQWTLRELIAAAYGVRSSQVSGPDWLSHERFDIKANVPLGTPKGEMNDMLQSLLAERFALSAHSLAHNEQVYALTVEEGGPKLTPAALTRDRSQTSSKEEQTDQAMQGLALQMKQMKTLHQNESLAGFSTRTWPSVTLEELAQRLEQFTGAPVMDQTGLTGRYSVTIEISNDPDSENTIFNALAKLGLKLERRKMPIETVVVDRASKTPTPN
jgi:uncharacterized protein (TIGR03435 family)